MQSVMFNSHHISVSKDTLHSHEILRRPPEAKIASLLSQKDQKNEITHQRTSRAAVYLLDPLISCCNATTYSINRAWPAWMWKELMLKTSRSYKHLHSHTVHTCTTGSFDTDKATVRLTYKQRRLPATTAALLVQIRCKLDVMEVVWHLPVLEENIIASIM